MKEKTQNDRTKVAHLEFLHSHLSQKSEVLRILRRARKYGFPWPLIILIPTIFWLIFLWTTYFSGSEYAFFD